MGQSESRPRLPKQVLWEMLTCQGMHKPPLHPVSDLLAGGKGGSLRMITIGKDEWGHLLRRGLTWEHLKTFVRRWDGVMYVGPTIMLTGGKRMAWKNGWTSFVTTDDGFRLQLPDRLVSDGPTVEALAAAISRMDYQVAAVYEPAVALDQFRESFDGLMMLLSRYYGRKECTFQCSTRLLPSVANANVMFDEIRLRHVTDIDRESVETVLRSCRSLDVHECTFRQQAEDAFADRVTRPESVVSKLCVSVGHNRLSSQTLARIVEQSTALQCLELRSERRSVNRMGVLRHNRRIPEIRVTLSSTVRTEQLRQLVNLMDAPGTQHLTVTAEDWIRSRPLDDTVLVQRISNKVRRNKHVRRLRFADLDRHPDWDRAVSTLLSDRRREAAIAKMMREETLMSGLHVWIGERSDSDTADVDTLFRLLQNAHDHYGRTKWWQRDVRTQERPCSHNATPIAVDMPSRPRQRLRLLHRQRQRCTAVA